MINPKFLLRQLEYKARQKFSHMTKINFTLPSYVTIALTWNCNLKCIHCTFANNYNSDEMPYDMAKNIIDEMRDWVPGAGIVLTGGEPLLWKGIFKLIEYIKRKDQYVMIITNGFHDEKTINKLNNSKIDLIKMSIDGYEKTQDIERGQENLFNIQKRNLKILKNKKIIINTILSRETIKDVVKIIEFTKEAGLNGIEFIPINVHDKSKFENWKEKYDLWPNDYNKVKKAITSIKRLKNMGYPVINQINHLNEILKYYKNPYSLKIKCLSPYQRLNIYPKGEIRLCNKKQIGNIRKTTIKSAWNGKEANKYRITKSKCKDICRIQNCNVNETVKERIDRLRRFLK